MITLALATRRFGAISSINLLRLLDQIVGALSARGSIGVFPNSDIVLYTL